MIRSFLDHGHGSRTHLTLEKDAPDFRAVQPRDKGCVVAIPRPLIAAFVPVPEIPSMNVIDFGMSIEAAVAAGRISFYEPDAIGVEESIPASVRKQLADMGHKLRVVSAIGNAHGLMIFYDSAGRPARFRGAADPRGDGKAQGY